MEKQMRFYCLLVLALTYCGCKQSKVTRPETPIVYGWKKAKSTISIDQDGIFIPALKDSTGESNKDIFYFRIVHSLKDFNDSMEVSILDTGLDIDVLTRIISEGKVVNGFIKGSAAIDGSSLQIKMEASDNRATAKIEFIELTWDSLIEFGSRSVIREKIYLQGGETDSVLHELIRKRVYRLGLWDQYYQGKPRPKFSSNEKIIYRAKHKIYETELVRKN